VAWIKFPPLVEKIIPFWFNVVWLVVSTPFHREIMIITWDIEIKYFQTPLYLSTKVCKLLRYFQEKRYNVSSLLLFCGLVWIKMLLFEIPRKRGNMHTLLCDHSQKHLHHIKVFSAIYTRTLSYISVSIPCYLIVLYIYGEKRHKIKFSLILYNYIDI
jgi:hypothetical protein